ncbi:MFS general substrate transporter [Periconia macrospinosa]|uniref:MFS general substrate transporter n=1 Tax=Periconia macrospinosa TaxID=97972 RepID=A0A2V1D8G6_9PLEO|nr:MFS general substrate transporter [Periconia macrospinosa]
MEQQKNSSLESCQQAIRIADDATSFRHSNVSQNSKKSFSFYMSISSLWLLALITSWDATALAIALPAITSQLRGTTLQSFWASISFILGAAITQPIYVTVSDVFGRKQPLYASMLLFTVGSIVFATANSIIALIIGRLIQGLGAGGLDVLEEIILADITNLKERPFYLGLISGAVAIGSITGPIIGGLFSQFVTWRWIGWINLPITGTAFLLAFSFLRIRPIPLSLRAKLRRLDWVGILLFIIGATATALPLSWAGALYSWSSWRTIVPLVIGLAVLVLFVLYEKRPKDAILPYRIFSNKTAIFSLVSGLVHGFILHTLLLYLPLFFQAVYVEAPLEAAKSVLPICFLTIAFSVAAPIIIQVTRRYRVLLWFGWAILTLFMGLTYLIEPSKSPAKTYTFQVFLGMGLGIVFTATQVPMQASVKDVDDTGLAVGMLVCFRLTGALGGLAICSTAFISVFQRKINSLVPLPESFSILQDSRHAIELIPIINTLEIPGELLKEVLGVYHKAFQAVWIILTTFSFVGLCASLFIEELTLEREEIGRQGFEHDS